MPPWPRISCRRRRERSGVAPPLRNPGPGRHRARPGQLAEDAPLRAPPSRPRYPDAIRRVLLPLVQRRLRQREQVLGAQRLAVRECDHAGGHGGHLARAEVGERVAGHHPAPPNPQTAAPLPPPPRAEEGGPLAPPPPPPIG